MLVLRPKTAGSLKLQTCWLGPYHVKARVGENSYQVKMPRGSHLDVHATQLKLCHWEVITEPVNLEIPPTQVNMDLPPNRSLGPNFGDEQELEGDPDLGQEGGSEPEPLEE